MPQTEMTCHSPATEQAPDGATRIALIGSPNGGKTSIFNQLTGLHAKTGNYPGVTVSRSEGVARIHDHTFAIEDLPGTYSLSPISPDEQVVVDVLDGRMDQVSAPDALVVVADATALRRSLLLLAEVLPRHLPTAVVVTMTDELRRRQGSLDVTALSQALGVPVVAVVANRGIGIGELRNLLTTWHDWDRPPLDPPGRSSELAGWVDSVLDTAGYEDPDPDSRTERIDKVLLHPVWGTIVFFAVMFLFFQALFTWAAPLQDAVEGFFDWLASLVGEHVGNPILASLLGDGILGGVGAVLTFVPQILLMYLLLALLDAVGYMSRAAFLMDKVMSRAGLEGRAFVAMLSSFACAIPGIMATRTIPSAKDRIATMLSAPLATCSARLPVYVLLVGILVPAGSSLGPVSVRGLVLFGMYLLGALSAMLAARVVKKITDRSGTLLPFYMGATIVIWALTTFPLRSDAEMTAAGVDPSDEVAATAYNMEHSAAAKVGKAIEPVFAPQGFDWRVNISLIGSMAAREVAVSTLGQVASASDPEDDVSVSESVQKWTYTDGPHQGEKVFTPDTTIAMLIFFAFALQCVATIGILKRESGSWKWPAIAFGYMFVLAWVGSSLAAIITRVVM